MEEIQNKKSGVSASRILLGAILIIIGGLFLLDNLDILYFDVPRIVFSFPMVLIILGLIIMINSRRKNFGILIFVIGIILFFPRIFPWIHYNATIIFPIIIILIGIFILARRRGDSSGYNVFHGSKDNSYRGDKIDEVSIFGGGEKKVFSDNFQGGNVTSIFGGSEIDLTNCRLAPGENIIDVLAIFGGNTFIVPKDWNVRTDVLPIFGGFSNKIYRDPNLVLDKDKVLVIKGTVLFGGGEIKSYH